MTFVPCESSGYVTLSKSSRTDTPRRCSGKICTKLFLVACQLSPCIAACPEKGSGDDASFDPRLLSVGRERFVRDEIEVPFDRKAELSSQRHDLSQGEVTKLRKAKTKIAQSEQSIRVIGIGFADEPRCGSIWSEQLGDRNMVGTVVERVDQELDRKSVV